MYTFGTNRRHRPMAKNPPMRYEKKLGMGISGARSGRKLALTLPLSPRMTTSGREWNVDG